MSNNYISGATTAINNAGSQGNGTPLMTGNTCSNVTKTTGCNVITGDLGAQKFTGAVTTGALATPTLTLLPFAVASGRNSGRRNSILLSGTGQKRFWIFGSANGKMCDYWY